MLSSVKPTTTTTTMPVMLIYTHTETYTNKQLTELAHLEQTISSAKSCCHIISTKNIVLLLIINTVLALVNSLQLTCKPFNSDNHKSIAVLRWFCPKGLAQKAANLQANNCSHDWANLRANWLLGIIRLLSKADLKFFLMANQCWYMQVVMEF